MPEWDREKYPYACIVRDFLSDNDYYLIITDTPLCYFYKNEGNQAGDVGIYSVGAEVCYQGYGVSSDGSTWELHKEGAGQIANFWPPIWANTDMKAYLATDNGDGWYNFELLGTIGLQASEPIPVGVSTLDPQSFMMGWLVGRRIAAMRGKKT